MFGYPVAAVVPPVVAAIPRAAVAPAGVQLAAGLLSGIAAGVVLVGVWHVLSSHWPSRHAVAPRQRVDALDEAA